MPPSPNCKRGDVALALFPNSDLRTAKLRPFLVVQADHLETGLGQVVVAMVSSQMFRAGHLSRGQSPEGQSSGLLTDSIVMTDNLATVIESALSRVIGVLPMSAVDKALRHTLSL